MLHLVDILLFCLFLMPVMVYCTVLGLINRRPQPLMVSGVWDFIGVVMATSGFLLFAGPALLSGTFQQSLRELPLRYEGGTIGDALANLWSGWWTVWSLYYLLVVGGAVLLAWTRRGTTVIYNVDPRTLDNALARAAQGLGLEIRSHGNHRSFTLRPADGALAGWEPIAGPHRATIELEPFPMLSNVAVHWGQTPPETRADMERELRKALAEVFTLESAVGGWLLCIAGFLLLLIMLLTALFVVILMTFTRR